MDVERVVKRDFPADQFDDVIKILDEYGTKDSRCERDRVQLAVLKLAAKNLEALRSYIETAKCDYRDVLAPAEYPGYKKTFRIYDLPAEEQQPIIDADWNHYQTWLTHENPALIDLGDQHPPPFHGKVSNTSRVAQASFALALIALAVGTACIMGEHWRPGLILILAGVAGTMTSARPMFIAWQTRKRTKQQSTHDDHAA
jgi:hypothetical protein